MISRESQAIDERETMKEAWTVVYKSRVEQRPTRDPLNHTVEVDIPRLKLKLQRLCLGKRDMKSKFEICS